MEFPLYESTRTTPRDIDMALVRCIVPVVRGCLLEENVQHRAHSALLVRSGTNYQHIYTVFHGNCEVLCIRQMDGMPLPSLVGCLYTVTSSLPVLYAVECLIDPSILDLHPLLAIEMLHSIWSAEMVPGGNGGWAIHRRGCRLKDNGWFTLLEPMELRALQDSLASHRLQLPE